MISIENTAVKTVEDYHKRLEDIKKSIKRNQDLSVSGLCSHLGIIRILDDIERQKRELHFYENHWPIRFKDEN